MGGGRTIYGTHSRDNKPVQLVLNVLLPDSTLLSGNAQQGTRAPCASLPDSWATDGETGPLVYVCYWMTFLESLEPRAP